MGIPNVYTPGEKNAKSDYLFAWNWPLITADKLGLFGDTDQAALDPYSGMPGNAADFYQLDPSMLTLSGAAGGQNAPLDKFANESMRNGPSQGTQFALKQNAWNAVRGRDQARGLASGMGKNASAQLAMKGGLGGGAQERINKYSTNVGMDAANQVDANAGANRANLMIADEGARTGNLASAAGLIGNNQKQKYDMMAGDIGRLQGNLDRRNAYNMNLYNQNMAAWAAGKQAQATASSGGGKK